MVLDEVTLDESTGASLIPQEDADAASYDCVVDDLVVRADGVHIDAGPFVVDEGVVGDEIAVRSPQLNTLEVVHHDVVLDDVVMRALVVVTDTDAPITILPMHTAVAQGEALDTDSPRNEVDTVADVVRVDDRGLLLLPDE